MSSIGSSQRSNRAGEERCSSSASPVALDDSYSVSWNWTLQIAAPGVLGNDSDPNEDALTAVLVSGPSSGTLQLNSDGSFTFTPATNFSGSDSFTYCAFDGTDPSNVATVTIDIAANHVPEADPQSISLDEDASAAIMLSGSDVDGDPLTYEVVSQPLHGILGGTAPNLVYTPEANYFGADSFTFLASDGTDDSPPATVSLTTVPVNDPPTADNQSLTTDEDTALAITLTGSDIESDPLTFQIVNGPSHGSLSGTAPNLVYTPESDYYGSDSFAFVARDGAANSLPATISLIVNPVNDAPVAVDDSASTPQDTPVLISLLENDSDVDGPSLSIQSLSTPAHGTLVNHGNGTVTYTPVAGYIGLDTFTYVVTDGEYSDSATVTVDVQASQVTLTFSNNSPTTIRDWSTTTSTISVPTAMEILDVNVQLDISHRRDQDLDIYLRSPDGTRVELFTDVGGNGDHFAGTVLDDQASVSITAGSAPFSGTYRPEGSLAAFSGQNAVGTWTLEITDDRFFYSGTLDSWSLIVHRRTDGAIGRDSRRCPGPNNTAVLDQATAQQAVAQALSSWSAYTNVDPLPQINVYVSDLPAGYLGLAWGHSLTLDVSANGAGWFVDSTPWTHSEFVGGQTAANQQMDLLTVVSHEIGHLLGNVHSNDAGDLMAATLPLGTRRLPGDIALTTQGSPRSIVDLPLLPEMRLNGTQTNLVDHTIKLSNLSDESSADDGLWPLPSMPADDGFRPSVSSEALQAQILHSIADEEAGLLSEDLLDLIAAGQE